MFVRIVAVGRMKSGPERDLVERYIDRFRNSGRPLGITGADIVEVPDSRAASPGERRHQEGERILAALDKSDIWTLLDERGKSSSSTDFASRLRGLTERGTGRCAFVIGGADGVSDRLRTEAPATLCFGTMTWPHQLVRILLCEQLYRSATILTDHPYHRGG
ncbi:MAG: 23S rRNA (pseudouridine(1915)-N(3))-methyltransferase RlmH [Pseudomonadota bacterium]